MFFSFIELIYQCDAVSSRFWLSDDKYTDVQVIWNKMKNDETSWNACKSTFVSVQTSNIQCFVEIDWLESAARPMIVNGNRFFS